MSSRPSRPQPGTSFSSGVATKRGHFQSMSAARRSPSGHTAGDGVPSTEAILYSVSGSDEPGKRGRKVYSSAMMAPTAHRSMGAVVDSGAQQHFGRAVPARADVVGVGRAGADLAGQAEVGELDEGPVVLAGDEEVLGLHVAVEEALAVHVGQAQQDLVAG